MGRRSFLKIVHIVFLVMMTVICSFPRADAATTFLQGTMFSAPNAQLHAYPLHSGPSESRVLWSAIRKFRRRPSHFLLTTHLSLAFLMDPAIWLEKYGLIPNDRIFSRDPDPLVHPPA